MDNRYQDGDWENPQDEEERRVGRLERELASVSHSEDKKISWGLPILLAVMLSHYVLPNLVNPVLVATVGVGGIVGGLGWVIYSNIRRKRAILIKYGLKCRECNHLPSRINASGVDASGRCPKCNCSLDI
jgi:hypothetical protein